SIAFPGRRAWSVARPSTSGATSNDSCYYCSQNNPKAMRSRRLIIMMKTGVKRHLHFTAKPAGRWLKETYDATPSIETLGKLSDDTDQCRARPDAKRDGLDPRHGPRPAERCSSQCDNYGYQ